MRRVRRDGFIDECGAIFASSPLDSVNKSTFPAILIRITSPFYALWFATCAHKMIRMCVMSIFPASLLSTIDHSPSRNVASSSYIDYQP